MSRDPELELVKQKLMEQLSSIISDTTDGGRMWAWMNLFKRTVPFAWSLLTSAIVIVLIGATVNLFWREFGIITGLPQWVLAVLGVITATVSALLSFSEPFWRAVGSSRVVVELAMRLSASGGTRGFIEGAVRQESSIAALLVSERIAKATRSTAYTGAFVALVGITWPVLEVQRWTILAASCISAAAWLDVWLLQRRIGDGRFCSTEADAREVVGFILRRAERGHDDQFTPDLITSEDIERYKRLNDEAGQTFEPGFAQSLS